jgi:single-stranded DNA-binding protein
VKKGDRIKITGSIYTSDWDISIEEDRTENKVSITMNLKIEEL